MIAIFDFSKVPLIGFKLPKISSKSVVFPVPLFPKIVTNSPLFNSKEKPNPCGCGSQQYYKTDNGTFIIDVCSSCGKDICISPKKKDFSEWKLETELNI